MSKEYKTGNSSKTPAEKGVEPLLKIFKWGIGAYCCFGGLGALSSGGFFSGVFLIVCGLFCLPPIGPLLEKKTPYKFPRWKKLSIIIICFILGGALLPHSAISKKPNTVREDLPKVFSNESSPTSTVDPDKQLKGNLEGLEVLLKDREKMLNSLSPEGFHDWLRIAISWTDAAQKSQNPEVVKRGKAIERSIQDYQIDMFPKFRQLFRDNIRWALRKSKTDVKIGGDKNDIISFTASIYTSKQNSKDTHDTILRTLELLRFKQDRYYSSQDSENTSWTLKTPNDSDLIRTQSNNK